MFKFSSFGEKAFALTTSIAKDKKRKRKTEEAWKLDPSDPYPKIVKLPMEALEKEKDYMVWYNERLDGVEYNPERGINGTVKENDGLHLTFIVRGLERVLLKKHFSHGVSLEEWSRVVDWRFRQTNKGATASQVMEIVS